MTLTRFIFGLVIVTGTVAAWSAWSGADGWTFAARIAVWLVLMQIGYVAFVLWTAYRAPARAGSGRGEAHGNGALDGGRRKSAKRAL